VKAQVFVGAAMSVALAVASSYAAEASPRPGASLASERSATFALASGHTSSRHWQTVGLPAPLHPQSGFDIRSRGRYAVRVRTHLTGGTVLFRVVDGGKVISPRSEVFSPTGHEHAFFFYGAGPKQTCGHRLRLQWRSANGRPVTLRAGTFAVHYSLAPHNTTACL
jgi:hypothetical protein